MIRGKRGIIKTEFPKILLAVICILILVALAFRLYYVFKGDKEKEKAQADLTNLDAKLQLNKDTEILLEPVGSEDWYLISWPQGEKIPDFCKKRLWNNCLCVCKKKDVTLAIYTTLEDCNLNSICVESKKPIEISGKEYFTGDITLIPGIEWSKIFGITYHRRTNGFTSLKNIFVLNIEQTDNNIKLSLKQN